ncbi:MAG: hypothetical protein ACK4MH_02820 [Brevundimonas sp.]|uniref:hypothetical protein n=1 Tax=Brevundimonas sp. TaxID=1871086 RepID=UPI00391BC706
MSCEQNKAVSPSPATPVATDEFIAASADIDRSSLPALIAAFDADPVGVIDRLERDIGGQSALRRYATAMVEQGQAENLGRQLTLILNRGDDLARPDNQDGAVWYPHAEDAGFFAGGVGAVLSSHPDALAAFSRGTGRSAPAASDDLQAWLSAAVADLPRPARSAFDDAFRAAAYQPD